MFNRGIIATMATYDKIHVGEGSESVTNTFLMAALASCIVGLSTVLGAIPIYFVRQMKQETMGIILGFAAGIMLAATSFSLLIPALELAVGSGWLIFTVAVGVVAGGLVVDMIDKFVPHLHPVAGAEGHSTKRLSRITLFIIAIAIHNFPEGLAVGVSYGSGDWHRGLGIALGIALQNIPEGMSVAFPLLSQGMTRTKIVLITLLTGVVETIGGLIGASIVQVSTSILPFALAFAAGAMLFVISDEIIPETHQNHNHRIATYGVLAGFIVMMLLDTML